tara:strand:+ start:386 stop:523 length:138 start_codon:yes stop_codon:yes gene_type:complete
MSHERIFTTMETSVQIIKIETQQSQRENGWNKNGPRHEDGAGFVW